MAFDLNAVGGYGNGEHGDLNLDDLTPLAINWVADAVAITDIQNDATTLTINNIIITAMEDRWSQIAFNVGTEVLLYVDGEPTGGGLTNADAMIWVGRWVVAKITASNVTVGYDSSITVNKDLTELSDAFYSGCILKVVNIPHLKDVTINAGSSIVPPQTGYPVAFKCSGTLTFNGGHIDLHDKGNSTQMRPLLNQENNGTVDTDKYAGWENSATKDRFVMNSGDGAAFIIANNITVANADSRIGNPSTYGVQYCRGATDSYNVPSGVTNLGGSTILLVAGTFTDFTPKLIAKYRSGTAGSGLARCYIASGTRLTNDEGLYAYDNISDPTVVTSTLKIKSFGDGSKGAHASRIMLWSNFAAVTAFDKTRKVLTVNNMTTDGSVDFAPGVLVMVHAKNKDSTNTKNAGRFYLATILGVNGNDITLDTAAPYNTFNAWLDTYYVQILTIPQFTNFKITNANSSDSPIPAWSDKKGYGGMLAIAVNNTCDLSGQVFHAMKCGGGAPYGRNGLTHIGNAQDCGRLPIGQGHGSVFILAKNLVMDSGTRIGAIYSGATSDGNNYGGRGGDPRLNPTGTVGVSGGGYHGAASSAHIQIKTENIVFHGGGGAGGSGGGKSASDYGTLSTGGHTGGFGSNGYGIMLNTGNIADGKPNPNARQGAHIMIIADKITGFNQAAISTGGQGGVHMTVTTAAGDAATGGNGSAGYGGGGAASHDAPGKAYGGEGGYNGGGGGADCGTCNQSAGSGGGSSGWAFIYCNNAVNQDTTDTVVD